MPVPPATYRVDSLGGYNPDSVVVAASPSASSVALIRMRRTLERATFRPAVLFPDKCAVPGIGTLRFTMR
jgi:hypothetical protein